MISNFYFVSLLRTKFVQFCVNIEVCEGRPNICAVAFAFLKSNPRIRGPFRKKMSRFEVHSKKWNIRCLNEIELNVEQVLLSEITFIRSNQVSHIHQKMKQTKIRFNYFSYQCKFLDLGKSIAAIQFAKN